MADKVHLDALKKGADYWNFHKKEWEQQEKGPIDLSHAPLEEKKLRRYNFNSVNLIDADLSGADLSGADLEKADLSGADLEKADLTGARLSGANLADADLTKANLNNADLTGATLQHARLQGASLINANLTDARLEGVIFSGADLRGAVLPDGVDFADQVRLAVETLRETRPVFLTLVLMIIYALIALFAVPQTPETQTVLLFVGQELSRTGFFITSSALVLLIQLYAMARLQRFWEIGIRAPRHLSDGFMTFSKTGGWGPAEFAWTQLKLPSTGEPSTGKMLDKSPHRRLLSFFFCVVAWFLAPLFTGIMTMTAFYEWYGVTGAGWPWTAMVCGMFFVISAGISYFFYFLTCQSLERAGK